jgi:hypothetical protein
VPPWARASELDRVLSCPASAHLARIQDSPGEAAQWGTLVHRWKETGEWPEDNQATRRRQRALEAAGVTRESLWPSGGRHEVTFALCVRSAFVEAYTGPPEGANAWKASWNDQWITGTMDYMGDVLGDPWVDDLKTGNPAHALPGWQFRAYAVAAWGLAEARRQLQLSVTYWPRYPADGPPRRVWSAPVEAHTISRWCTELTTARDAVLRSQRNHATRIGGHCTFCRCRPHCPEWASWPELHQQPQPQKEQEKR